MHSLEDGRPQTASARIGKIESRESQVGRVSKGGDRVVGTNETGSLNAGIEGTAAGNQFETTSRRRRRADLVGAVNVDPEDIFVRGSVVEHMRPATSHGFAQDAIVLPVDQVDGRVGFERTVTSGIGAGKTDAIQDVLWTRRRVEV